MEGNPMEERQHGLSLGKEQWWPPLSGQPLPRSPQHSRVTCRIGQAKQQASLQRIPAVALVSRSA